MISPAPDPAFKFVASRLVRLPLLARAPGFEDALRDVGGFASGDRFAGLARDFFARLTYRSLDDYLSRELANHKGAGQRFADDAQRTAFTQALAPHTFESSRSVQEFAGGWYGKTVWQSQALDQAAIDRFTDYAFEKMRSALGRPRADA